MNINDYGLGILVEEKSSREKFDNIQTEIIEEVESEINNELLLPPCPRRKTSVCFLQILIIIRQFQPRQVLCMRHLQV